MPARKIKIAITFLENDEVTSTSLTCEVVNFEEARAICNHFAKSPDVLGIYWEPIKEVD